MLITTSHLDFEAFVRKEGFQLDLTRGPFDYVNRGTRKLYVAFLAAKSKKVQYDAEDIVQTDFAKAMSAIMAVAIQSNEPSYDEDCPKGLGGDFGGGGASGSWDDSSDTSSSD